MAAARSGAAWPGGRLVARAAVAAKADAPSSAADSKSDGTEAAAPGHQSPLLFLHLAPPGHDFDDQAPEDAGQDQYLEDCVQGGKLRSLIILNLHSCNYIITFITVFVSITLNIKIILLNAMTIS